MIRCAVQCVCVYVHAASASSGTYSKIDHLVCFDSHENVDTSFECACRSVENEAGNSQELDSSSSENHSRADSSSRLPVAARLAEIDANKNLTSMRSSSSSESNDNSGSLASFHHPVTGCSAIRRDGLRDGHIDDVRAAAHSVRRGGAASELMSLRDEIDESNRRGIVGNGTILSRNQSCEKGDEGDSDGGSCPNTNGRDENQGSEMTHEFFDSATESEIAAHDPRTPPNKV